MVHSSSSSKTTLAVDVERAQAIWREYCDQHDTALLRGQTAGIEPVSGKIWFGESASDVYRQKISDGVEAPMYVVRIGFDHYLRKGRRR